MKSKITMILFCLLGLNMVAQPPQAFKYQAVARDLSGNVLAGKSVSFRISILEGSMTGPTLYRETHSGKTTNAFGLVELEIGKGSVISGSFSAISWGTNSCFIKVEMDPAGGTAFQAMGTSQLLSVPYALQAKSVERATGLVLPYKDSTTVPDKETVFKLTCIGNTWSSAITGTSKSTNGTGVVGEGAFGVVGYATASGGTGVRGVNASTTGSGWGLSGVVNSPEGGGIWGYGGLYGLKADAGSSSGYGIYGTASSSSGTTYAVYGRVISPAGYSGYFKGGKFHVSGRAGIGTESPSAGLHLKGTGYPDSFMFLEADAGQDAGFRLYEGSTAKWHLFNDTGAGGLNIYNNAGQTAIFCKQSGSLVGINTTAPTQTLDVNGVARIRGMMTGVVATTVYRTSDGTLITGASDIRLKENIAPLQNSLDKVMKLQGVTFTWKADPVKKQNIGFIAQEFEKVIPELVFTNEADGFKGINYAEISAVLVEAIRELKAENDLLKTENGQLKESDKQISSRLERLEKLIGANALK